MSDWKSKALARLPGCALVTRRRAGYVEARLYSGGVVVQVGYGPTLDCAQAACLRYLVPDILGTQLDTKGSES